MGIEPKMPELLWHKTNILEAVPDFGIRLPLALEATEFISQFLQSGYVHDGQGGVDGYPLTPLDDLKGWLRVLPSHSSEGLEDLREILLGLENEARKQAGLDGAGFDLVEFELEQMDHDDTWEAFEPVVARRVLEVVLDEADEIAPQLELQTGYPFFLSLGFSLPRPDKHPFLKEAEITKALEDYSGGAKTSLDSQCLQGAVNLDFFLKEAPPLKRDAECGVARVPLEDNRVGDKVKLQLSVAYHLKAEGYFLAVFDGIAKSMRLKS